MDNQNIIEFNLFIALYLCVVFLLKLRGFDVLGDNLKPPKSKPSMKSQTGVMQDTISREHYNFIYRRVNGLIMWWGRFINQYDVHDLAVACYQQGIIDALQMIENRATPTPKDQMTKIEEAIKECETVIKDMSITYQGATAIRSVLCALSDAQKAKELAEQRLRKVESLWTWYADYGDYFGGRLYGKSFPETIDSLPDAKEGGV